MLLTNVTRSASYEALPNHRLFPARSGLTSRFPLRHRCLRHLRSNKSGDAVGRPSCRSSLLGHPGTKFLVETSRTVKNSLNYASTCLRVVDTRRNAVRRCASFNRSISSRMVVGVLTFRAVLPESTIIPCTCGVPHFGVFVVCRPLVTQISLPHLAVRIPKLTFVLVLYPSPTHSVWSAGGRSNVCITTQYCSVFSRNPRSCSGLTLGAATSK